MFDLGITKQKAKNQLKLEREVEKLREQERFEKENPGKALADKIGERVFIAALLLGWLYQFAWIAKTGDNMSEFMMVVSIVGQILFPLGGLMGLFHFFF